MTCRNILKCINIDKLGFDSRLCLLAYLAFSFVVVFCFQLGDLVTTSWHGYKVWDFLAEGKIWNFFVLCKQLPGFDGAGYDPPIYLIFALWNLPIWIIHKITGISISPGIVTYWSRALLMILYFLSSSLLKDIASLIALQEDDGISSRDEMLCNSKSANIMFLMTPFAFFAVVVLGCYDIIPIFFSLLAIRAYLKGNLIAFSCWFGGANIFKYITFVIYIPLLLLLEKRSRKIALLMAFGTIPSLLSISMTRIMPSLGSQVELNDRVVVKFFAWTVSNGHSVPASVFFIGYFIICFFAYGLKCSSKGERNRWMTFIPLLCFSWLFIAIAPNPQWTVFLAPFLVLNLCLNPDHKNTLLLAEAGAFIGFTGMCFVSTHTDEQLIDVCSALAYVFRFQKLYHNFRFDTCALTSSIQCLPSILLSLYIASLACFNLFSLPIRKMHLGTGTTITRKDMLLRFCVILVFIVPVAICYTLSYIYR